MKYHFIQCFMKFEMVEIDFCCRNGFLETNFVLMQDIRGWDEKFWRNSL